MIRIRQAVIVEGKYDKIRLSAVLDALIIETDGFRVFSDKEKQKLIRSLAQKQGLLVLTDSDRAGFRIRAFIGGSVPAHQVRHVYIPDVFGKEKRKQTPSKEGKIGVEGISTALLLEAFKQAGIQCDTLEQTDEETKKRQITKADFYASGLSGGVDSHGKRLRLQRSLGLPERLSANALLPVLNALLTFEEYEEQVKLL